MNPDVVESEARRVWLWYDVIWDGMGWDGSKEESDRDGDADGFSRISPQ
jgi:hypothetical protein